MYKTYIRKNKVMKMYAKDKMKLFVVRVLESEVHENKPDQKKKVGHMKIR